MYFKDFIPLVAALIALLGVMMTAFVSIVVFCITQILMRRSRQLETKRGHYMDLCGHWKKQELRAISLQTELQASILRLKIEASEAAPDQNIQSLDPLQGLKLQERRIQVMLEFTASLEDAAATLARVKLCASSRLRENLAAVDDQTRRIMASLPKRQVALFQSFELPSDDVIIQNLAYTVSDIIKLQAYMVEARVSMSLELIEPWFKGAKLLELEEDFRRHENADVDNLLNWAKDHFGKSFPTKLT